MLMFSRLRIGNQRSVNECQHQGTGLAEPEASWSAVLISVQQQGDP